MDRSPLHVSRESGSPRNDVPIGAYDLLGVNRFLSDPASYGRIDIGTDDGPLIADGWHGEERDGSVTFRWASSPVTLLVPLDRAANLLVQVRAQAFGYPGLRRRRRPT